MKRLVLLAFPLAACHHASAPATVESPDVVAPTRVIADQVYLAPEALLAHGPDATTPRVLLAHTDRAWVRLDGEPLVPDAPEPLEPGETPEPPDPDEPPVTDAVQWVLPVLETRGTKVRISDGDGDIELLLWIDRASLGQVITTETGVARGPDEDPARPGEIGVWLRPGTPVAQLRAASSKARRAITIDDDGLSITGEIAAGALGDQWVPPAPLPEADDVQFLDNHVPIRATADRDGPVIAQAEWNVAVVVDAASHGDPVLVTTESDHAIARGYVPAGALGDYHGGTIDTVGPGFSVRKKGRTYMTFPSGTCLYDAVDGALVAVVHRPGEYEQHVAAEGWYLLGVTSAWGDFDTYAHDTSTVPGTVSLASCAEAKPR